MLQPVQLQEVSRRFAEEIFELRAFLTQTGIPVGTPQALPDVAARLASDRSFHRDLMSSVWVIIDQSQAPLRYADLLGMLTIAGSGIRGAAASEEQVAHALLRFLMESKHALDSSSITPKRAQVSDKVTAAPDFKPLPVVSERTVAPPGSLSLLAQQVASQAPFTKPLSAQAEPRPLAPTAQASVARAERQPEPRPSLSGATSEAEDPEEVTAPAPGRVQMRRLIIRLAIAACILASAFLGFHMLHRANTPKGGVPAAASGKPAPQGASGAVSFPQEDSSGTPQTSPPARVYGTPALRSSQEKGKPFFGAVGIQKDAAKALVSTSSASVREKPAPDPNSFTASVPSTPAWPSLPANSAPATVIRSPQGGSRTPVVVPAETLSRRLDSPALPGYASDPDVDSTGKRYPRLHRRLTNGVAQSVQSDPELVAEMHTPDALAVSPAMRHAAPTNEVHGMVRSTCVGMMAGNLIYSPTPAYPAAAAVARVQGEVKVQATIDRDGTINSARVVSGPPLLRDAALDAVQHWRYKPYVAGGKAAQTATLAVLEFVLE